MKKILFLLFTAISIASYSQAPCTDGKIIVDGVTMDAVSFDNTSSSGLKLPFWLPENSTLASGDRVAFINVIEFTIISGASQTLEFSKVLKIGSSPQTVPAGKTWKVESILKYENAFTSNPVVSSNSPICEGATLNLSANTIQGASYNWTGPNGFTSSLQNPVITNVSLAHAGSYSLIVTLNGCTSSSVATNVIINPNPSSAFTSDPPSPIVNYNATFTPAVTGLSSYSWTFALGNPTSSSAEIPLVQWSAAGNNNVSLTVIDANGCTSSTQQVVAVINCVPGQPSSAFTWNPTTAGNGVPVTFTPSVSGQTYAWTFQGSPSFGGGTGTTSENPVVTWASAGSYVVDLTVTDNTGCFTSNTQAINIIACAPSSNTTLSFTGTVQSFTVPNCVSTVTIEVWGAQGADGSGSNNGGKGGYSKGDLTVTSGETLYVYVGGAGNGTTGGFNGGGDGSNAGGGGASDVRKGGTDLSNRVIVAGGGGGKTAWTEGNAGDGGGSSGTAGSKSNTYSPCNCYATGGGGGTQSGGGSYGIPVNQSGNNGVAGTLGVGGGPDNWNNGGGGGGYYGGGSGGTPGYSGWGAAGGGGSGYVGGVTNSSTQTGIRSGNGLVVISW